MMIFIFQPSVGCGSNTSSVFYAFQCDSDLSCVCAIQLSIKYLDTGHLVISTLKVFSMLIRIRSTKVQVRKYFGVSCYSHFQPPGQQLPSSIIAPYINAHAMEDREKRTLRLTLPSWSCLMLKEDSLPRRSSSCSFLLLATFVAIAPSSHNPLGHQGARTEKMERKHGVCVCVGGFSCSSFLFPSFSAQLEGFSCSSLCTTVLSSGFPAALFSGWGIYKENMANALPVHWYFEF